MKRDTIFTAQCQCGRRRPAGCDFCNVCFYSLPRALRFELTDRALGSVEKAAKWLEARGSATPSSKLHA